MSENNSHTNETTPADTPSQAHDAARLGRQESERDITCDGIGALVAISHALAGRLELQKVLDGTLNLVKDVVGAEGSSILLIDPETKAMRFYMAAGPGAEKAKAVPMPAGAGICGYVAETGKPLVVNDAQNDPRLDHRVDQTTSMTTKNVLCVPINSHQRMWGVLELINKIDADGFNFDDLRLAEVVAAQTGLALENAQLHEEIVHQERMAAIGQTVSGLAHCIKNILNGIKSGSTVVERSVSKGDLSQVRRGWETVRQNNKMLGNLVLDMLSLARQAEPHPFPTDINQLTEQICDLLAEAAAEQNINIAFTPADILNEVMVDPTHIYRCLLNLVTNAVEACSGGGEVNVDIQYREGESRFTISVSDNGSGIAPEDQDKMFTEFFTTKGGRGTGLGLPVTKKLINEMSGTITFDSVPGKGTKFVIALPARTDTDR